MEEFGREAIRANGGRATQTAPIPSLLKTTDGARGSSLATVGTDLLVGGVLACKDRNARVEGDASDTPMVEGHQKPVAISFLIVGDAFDQATNASIEEGVRSTSVEGKSNLDPIWALWYLLVMTVF